MSNSDFLSVFLKFFSRAIMLLLVMPVTRCARGLVAKRMGDDTAEREGMITLNPFVHLDPIGSLLILLVGFGWGKPMNMNPSNFRNYRKGVILVSLSGPLSNLIMGYICLVIYQLMMCSDYVVNALSSGSISPIVCILYILYFLFSISTSLAVFYLLPIHPMDGFTILRFCAGGKFQQWYYRHEMQYRNISMIVLILIFLLPSSINPLVYLIGLVQNLLWLTVSWIPSVIG